MDLLSVDRGVILQVVNLKGVMGAGLAAAIRDRWPSIYTEYLRALRTDRLYLGGVLPVQVDPELWVMNLAAQDGYGRDRRYLHYGALTICLVAASNAAEALGLPVFAPYQMGCGLAGGSWEVVQELLFWYIPGITICAKD